MGEIGEGDGKGYAVNVHFNVPFKDIKYGDAEFLVVWEKLLLPIADKFKPNIILTLVGYDSGEYLPFFLNALLDYPIFKRSLRCTVSIIRFRIC
jgi:hypothetical protein